MGKEKRYSTHSEESHGKMVETSAEKSWTRQHPVSLENYDKATEAYDFRT